MAIAPSQKEAILSRYNITWEKLPADFVLPDDPVDNLIQPELAIALKESLGISGSNAESIPIATNFGICATVDGKTVVKAPDWVYIPNAFPLPPGQIRRSYTPYTEGDLPVVVMEFLSDTEGGEYSMKGTYPYGKWWFYERILQVPVYVIFQPSTGETEVYFLNSGRYEQQLPNAENRYWIEELELFLGVWQGTRSGMNAFWLRWWDAAGNMLLWATERVQLAIEEAQVAQEELQTAQQQAQIAQQQAEQECQKAEKLAQQLRSLGIDPDNIV